MKWCRHVEVDVVVVGCVIMTIWLVTYCYMSLTCIIFVCLVIFLYLWLHSCMLGYMYHSCNLGFKYCSFMFDYICSYMCVVDYALLMHVNVFMWLNVQWCSRFCHAWCHGTWLVYSCMVIGWRLRWCLYNAMLMFIHVWC